MIALRNYKTKRSEFQFQFEFETQIEIEIEIETKSNANGATETGHSLSQSQRQRQRHRPDRDKQRRLLNHVEPSKYVAEIFLDFNNIHTCKLTYIHTIRIYTSIRRDERNDGYDIDMINRQILKIKQFFFGIFLIQFK